MTPPSSCASDPIVALTAVPAASATSIRMIPSMRSSGEPNGARRRSRITATSTSSTFPQVCPSADPTGTTP